MKASLIEPDSPHWRRVLSDVDHDFSHLSGFTALSACKEKGEPIAFLAEEDDSRFMVPLIVRRLGTDVLPGMSQFFDATCAYGYPGPILHTANVRDDHFVDRALHTFIEVLRGRGIIAAFVRLHPILVAPLDALGHVGRVVRHGDTVSVDLSLTDEEIWRQTSSFHRRGIERARKQGYVARMDERWQHFDTFIEIYYQTMRRVGAQEFYYFSREYLTTLREILGDRLRLCVVEFEGKVAAAGLVTEMCGIVQIYLAGTRQEFLPYSPAKTMENFVRYWAKGRRNRFFHLGGGVSGENDSLFEYKAGFSHLRHPFFTWRVVSNEAAYLALVANWEARAGIRADGLDGFFPAYRKSLPDGEIGRGR